ncbi:MAG: hypothetical protein Q7S24_02110 [bacterium]|nr:hypothetical protein [bacterium]
MFRFVLVLGVLFNTMSANAQATGFVQVEGVADARSDTTITLDAYTSLKFGHGLSGTAFLRVTDGWAQAYMGPAWAPTDWLEIGVSVGGQQIDGKLDWRYATSVWAGYGVFSFLGIVEFDNFVFQGDDAGVWYDLKAMAQPLEWLAVGVEARRFVGVGPWVELKVPSTPLSVWCTWAPIDPEKLDGQLGHLSRFMFGAKASY